jgi:hypothetical protein
MTEGIVARIDRDSILVFSVDEVPVEMGVCICPEIAEF